MKRAVIAGNRRIEYTLIQSSRQNVLFQALPEGAIRVYAPRAMRLRDIDRMVRERADELTAMGKAVDARIEQDRRRHPVTDGSTIMVEGVPCAIRLTRGKARRGAVAEGELRLTLPDPDDDAAVRGAIRATLSARALERRAETAKQREEYRRHIHRQHQSGSRPEILF